MKYAYALAALAALVAAQDASTIPACAIKCLDDAIASTTTCARTDFLCTCEKDNHAKIQSASTSCVIAACGIQVAVQQVLPASEALCKAALANPSTTSKPAVATTSSVAAASSSAAASTSAVASSSAASSAASSSAAGTTSAPASASTDCPSTTMATTTTVAPCRACNGTVTTTSKPTASHVTVNGAAQLGSIGGLAMLAIGALAL